MSDSTVGDVDLSLEVLKGVSAKFTQAILGFAGTILFARILGPTSFGGFYILMSLVQVVNWPTEGWAIAGKKRYSEAESEKNEILGAQALLNLGLIVFVIIVSVLFANQLVSYTGIESAPYLFPLLVTTLVFFGPFQKLLTAEGHVSLQAWNDTLRSVTTFLFQIGLVFIGWGAVGMAIGWAASTALAVPITFHYIGVRPNVPSLSTLRSIVDFAKYSTWSAVFNMAYTRYDVLLLALILGPASSGYYEAALKLSIPASFISTIAGSGLMAKVSHRYSTGREFHQTVSRTLSHSTVLAIPMFFGGAVVAEDLVVTAYGSEYRSGAALLIGLLLYQVIRSQGKILTRTLSGIDRPNLIFRISGVVLAVNIVVGYALLIQIGPVGVVVGTVASEFLRYVLNAYYVRQYATDITLFPSELRHQTISGLVMAGVVYLLHGWVAVNSFIVLGTIIGFGAVTYVAALSVLSSEFRNTLFRALSGVLS